MAEPPHHRPDNIPTTKTELIPFDILFSNILPRLPAKSLVRFRSVSKQWHTLLRSPWFQDMHLHRVTNNDHQNHHKLLAFTSTPPPQSRFLFHMTSTPPPPPSPVLFHTIDCESPEDGFTAGRPLPFDVSSHEYKLEVLTSCRGLVCVGIIAKSWHADCISDLILWNPLTGDYKKLSKISNSDRKVRLDVRNVYGLYYSCCDDDYKLLCITHHHDAYIYSLKSETWRKIDFDQQLLNGIDRSSLLSPWTRVNEKLYTLFTRKVSTEPDTHFLIRFDTNTEKFTVLTTPIPGYIKGPSCFSHRGCLHLYGEYRCLRLYGDSWRRSVELWTLMDNGDGDIDAEDYNWEKVVTYAPQNIPYPVPQHLMRDGNWLWYTPSKGVVYNLDLANDIINISCTYNPRSMCISRSEGKYIETWESLNRYL